MSSGVIFILTGFYFTLMRKRFIVAERNLMKFNKVRTSASGKEVLPEKIWSRYGLSGEQLSWEGPDET